MLPIVQIPQLIEHYAPYFEDLFLPHKYEEFKRYVSGLIISENKTVEGINRHFVIQTKDQSTLNRFLTDSTYTAVGLNQRRLDFLQSNSITGFKPTGKIRGVLSIDDTLLTHYGKHFDDISRLKDPHNGVIDWSHNLVSLYYSDDRLDYPVYQKLWQPPDIEKLVAKLDELSIDLNEEKRKEKDQEVKAWRNYILHYQYRRKQYKYPELVEIYKTKLWLARDLVDQFIEQYPDIKLPFCFDRWYTKPMLCEHISSKNQIYVGRLESKTIIELKGKEDRTVLDFAEELKQEHLKNKTKPKFHKVGVKWRGTTTHYYAYCKTHTLTAFGKVRLVISYKNEDLSDKTPYLIICNQHTWRAAGILSVYRRRWPVEVFYEEAKAEGLNKYQIRQQEAIHKHIALISIVYSLLHAARYDQDLLSKLQQQLHQPIARLMEGSVAYWRRIVKAQTFLNLADWLSNKNTTKEDWKTLILPIVEIMAYQ